LGYFCPPIFFKSPLFYRSGVLEEVGPKREEGFFSREKICLKGGVFEIPQKGLGGGFGYPGFPTRENPKRVFPTQFGAMPKVPDKGSKFFGESWLRASNGKCNLRNGPIPNPLTGGYEDIVEATKRLQVGVVWDLGGMEMFATPPTTSPNSMNMLLSLLRWEKPM